LRPYRREGSIPAIDQSDHPNPWTARAAVLERLYDREASPVEFAKEIGVSLPNVAYHVRELHEQKNRPQRPRSD